MELAIRRDAIDLIFYMVTIGKHRIQTTWAQTSEKDIIEEWISEVIKANRTKNKKQTLIVGLKGDHSLNYVGLSPVHKKADGSPRLEVIQLCVGHHCLIYQMPLGYWDREVPKPLQDFLNAKGTVVVGVEVEKTVEKTKAFGLTVERALELRKLATKFIAGGNVDQMAKAVLGFEWEFVRPASMVWWADDWWYLSEDKVKFGTLDAFLVQKMAAKLLDVQ